MLAAFDAQRRGGLSVKLPPGAGESLDGPLYRCWGWGPRGFVVTTDLSRLPGEQLEALIRRQVEFFAAMGLGFEWKTYGHDRTAGLKERLLGAGFLPEPEENLMVAEVEELELDHPLPSGVGIRRARGRADTRRVAELLTKVWGEPLDYLEELFDRDLLANPDDVVLLLVEAGEELVSVARVNLTPGTDFASLWSGSTRADWRRRGIYRALVAHRAALAQERGFRYLQVDASGESRPILERLGFLKLSTTTPYIWSPPSRVGGGSS